MVYQRMSKPYLVFSQCVKLTGDCVCMYILTIRDCNKNFKVFGGVRMSILGCNNGGGGGNFSKIKRLVLKCIGTKKQLFPKILAAREGC